MSEQVLSSDLAFADFLRKCERNPRIEVVVWPETHLLNHLYDLDTDRLRPFASLPSPVGSVKRKRRRVTYHFTARQLEIAKASLKSSIAQSPEREQ